jgi:hypothetical protein
MSRHSIDSFSAVPNHDEAKLSDKAETFKVVLQGS